MPEITELPSEKRSHVVFEGRSLTCYRCCQREHIRKNCSHYISNVSIPNSMNYTSDCSEREEDIIEDEIQEEGVPKVNIEQENKEESYAEMTNKKEKKK